MFHRALAISVRAAARSSLPAIALTCTLGALWPASLRAELSLAVELNHDPVRPGSPVAPLIGPELDVRIAVANRGALPLANVSISVPLPEELQTVSRLGILGGTCNSLVGNVNNCNNPETITFAIGNLPPGSGRTVGFSTFVAELSDGAQVTIDAHATAGGEEASASQTFTVQSEPAFELALAADRDPVGAAEAMTYTLDWGHVAPARVAPEAVLRLELPEGTSFLSATGGGVFADGVVEWELGDLSPGESGEERVEVEVSGDLAEGTLLEALAEIADMDDLPEHADAFAVSRIENSVPLGLVLELGPDPLRSGGPASPGFGRTADVHLTVTNHGTVVLPAVRVEVPLPVRFDSLARLGIVGGGTCDSIVGNVNNCDYPERASFDLGDLEPGKGRTLAFSTFVRGLPDGSVVSLDAFAAAAAANVQVVAERALVVRSEPAFELALAEDREPVGTGEALTYTLSWGHVAPARIAPATTLRFELPEGTSFVAATSGGSFADGAVEWELGDLSPGEAGEERVVVEVADDLVEGTILAARASIRDEDDPAEIARAEGATRVENSLPLDFVLELGPNPLRSGAGGAGRTLDVRVTVTNRGGVVLPAVRVEAPLPARLDSLARLGIVGGGTCDSLVGNVNNCDFPERGAFDLGDLEPGQGRTLAFSAFVRSLPDGSIVTLEAFASAAAADVEATAKQSIIVQSEPAFELSLSEDHEPAGVGEALTYTLTWGHVADARVAPAATLRFELPAGTSFVAATAGGVLLDGAVEWELGDVSPGEAGEERVWVDVDPDLAEGTILEARAEIADEDDPAEIARASESTRVESALPLTLALELDPDPIRSGSPSPAGLARTLDVRLTVGNRGEAVLPAVRVEVPLTARLGSLARLGIIGGTCDSVVGNVNNCDFPERASFDLGDLDPGAGRTLAFSLLVSELPDGSVLSLAAFASAAAADVQVVSERSLVIESEPAFELSLSEDREPAGAGEEITYTLSWGHVAPARVAPATVLSFDVPAGASFVSATSDGAFADGVVTWDLGDLDPHSHGVRRVTVKAAGDLFEGSILEARAEIRDEGTPVEIARAHAATRIEDDVPLGIAMEIQPNPVLAGEVVDVEITVTNSGGVELPGVLVEIPLPERLQSVDRTKIAGGTCDSIVGNVNSCDRPERVIFDVGALEAGGTRTVGFSPRVLTTALGLPDGAIVRFRAFARSGELEAVDSVDVLIGEEDAGPSGLFVRGDANADGRIDITDAISTLNYLFTGAATPSCLDAADADDDSSVNITDPILVLGYLFLGQRDPAPPTGAIPDACGEDPTPDDGVSCLSYPPCND